MIHMSRRKEIFKDAGIYTASSYIAQLFDIVNGVLIRLFLGPTNMGIWAFLQVIQNYAKHAGLGVSTATARDVPYFLGKGDKEKAVLTQNLVFSFTLMTALAVACGLCVFAIWNRSQYSSSIFTGLLVVAGLILAQRIYNLFVVLLRSYKQFAFAGMLNIGSSLLSLFLTLLLTWPFQIYGFFAAMILNYLVMISWILWRTPYRFHFYWNLKQLLPLLSLGLSVVLADILRSILMSIDRIMIAKTLGFEQLGHYSVALMASNYLYSLPNMISIIFFPHLQEVFAQRDCAKDLAKYLEIPALCTAYLFPFLIGFVWLSADWFIEAILPQYQAGIPALKYLVLGTFFLALTHPFMSFLITVKKHWWIIPQHLVGVGAGFLTTFLFLQKGWGIQGVAVATSLTFLVHFLSLSVISWFQIEGSPRILRFYGKIAGIFIVFISLLALSDYLFSSWAAGGIKCLISFGFYTLMVSPLLILAEKEFRILSTVRQLLHDWTAKRISPKKKTVEGKVLA